MMKTILDNTDYPNLASNNEWKELNQVVDQDYHLGNYTKALANAKALLSLSVKTPNNPRIAITLNTMGNIYTVSGRFEEARRTYLLALAEAAKATEIGSMERSVIEDNINEWNHIIKDKHEESSAWLEILPITFGEIKHALQPENSQAKSPGYYADF